MKKIVITLSTLLFAYFSQAQTIAPNPFPRTIHVSGTAEIKIVPDELYSIITLKEYDKKGSGKIGIDKIREDFLTACKSIGIPDSSITIATYGGSNSDLWWRKKKRKEELYSSLSYQIKFSNSKMMDRLVDKLDDQATQSFQIIRTSHSMMEEYRKQLKIQAIKAAKDKAIYLTEAIGEKVGAAITISEPREIVQPLPYQYSNKVMGLAGNSMEANQAGLPAVDFNKITLRYEVNVTFAIGD